MQNETPYQNRELDEKLKVLRDLITENHADVMSEVSKILAQTMKTNGRTTKLENRSSWLAGAIAVVVLVVVPLTFWALSQVVRNSATIQVLESQLYSNRSASPQS